MTSGEDVASQAPKKSVPREYLESVVVAVILALFIRSFVVQAFKIPSASMETNLLIGDHLLVNKVIYSPSLGPFEDALFGKKPIRRGDVVVFKYPEEAEKDYIKRVIGLPGETIEVRNNQVYINGEPLDEPYLPANARIPHHSDPEYRVGSGDYSPSVVPPGHLFVMGDNRDNSRDSRSWGMLPRDNVKGRALLVYWSYEATRKDFEETGVLNWIRGTISAFAKTRWRRFFHIIR
jgi:signal peptidase I